MNGLGLRKLIDDFVKTIEDKLGITAIKETLRTIFEDLLNRLCEPIKAIADGTDIKSIADIILMVSLFMSGYNLKWIKFV
jgi:hypothetical protein